MEQPELGEHIAELRKMRGLTQEQLVEKCKVNVRTLQRIEAGTVVPRRYTLNAIYTALEYEPPKKATSFEEVAAKQKRFVYVLPVLLLCALVSFIYYMQTKPFGEKNYVMNNGRGIMYLYPSGLERYSTANVKDTADYWAGNTLIQEYEKQIFLNGKYITTVEEGDTVELNLHTWFNKEELLVHKYHPDTIPAFNGKNIVYIFPPISFGTMNSETGETYDFGGLKIRELDNKIYLNDECQGEAMSGDTVVFINGRISIIHHP